MTEKHDEKCEWECNKCGKITKEEISSLTKSDGSLMPVSGWRCDLKCGGQKICKKFKAKNHSPKGLRIKTQEKSFPQKDTPSIVGDTTAQTRNIEGTQNQEEFNLSDKLQKFEGWHSKENRFIHISHVKIFIKNNKLKSLKAKHCNPETLVIPLDWFLNEAGEELVK